MREFNVLVACEESQAVTIELREREINAFSCDIMDCSGGHNEWHIKADVLPLLNGNCTFKTVDGVEHTINGRWDMIIAFPPCTHLAVSGASWFEKKRADGRQREGIEFFAQFLKADCDKIAIENPVGIISGNYIRKWFPDLCEKYNLPRSYSQAIQPYYWGDTETKKTCLWLKNLPELTPDTTEKPHIQYVEWIDKRTGKKKRQSKFYTDVRGLSPEERSKARSKTFPGIAKAMAEQWGTYLKNYKRPLI